MGKLIVQSGEMKEMQLKKEKILPTCQNETLDIDSSGEDLSVVGIEKRVL